MAPSRTCDQCGKPLPPEGRFCSHCGSLSGSGESAADAAAAARVGPWERILERLRTVTASRYDVQRLLGWGGMAGVYLAEELRLKRRVAIKVIAPGLLMDPSQIERFEQEARTTAQLNHPNIVTIYEVDEREDLHYFTMTYVPGRALSQVMAEAASPLPVPVVEAWVRQVAGALSYAHQRGVVHRDIKPGNILLDEHGNALVGDFGIAKVAEEPGLTRTGMLVGTPAYMSPEQCTTGKVTGASDQYSLGAVAYQLLAGAPPFSGSTIQVIQAHVAEEPRDVRKLRPECPEELARVVMRMLAKKPEDRWPSLYDAVDAVGTETLRHDDPVRAVMAQLSAWTHAVRIDPPQALAGDGGRSTLGPGAAHRFSATTLDYRGEELPDRKITWSVEPAGVLEVDDDGGVRAVGPGRATLVAASGRVNAEWSVKVGSSSSTGPITPAEGIAATDVPALGDPSPTPGPPPPMEASDAAEGAVSAGGDPTSPEDGAGGGSVAAPVSDAPASPPSQAGGADDTDRGTEPAAAGPATPPRGQPALPTPAPGGPGSVATGAEADREGSGPARLPLPLPLLGGLGVVGVAAIALVFALRGPGEGGGASSEVQADPATDSVGFAGPAVTPGVPDPDSTSEAPAPADLTGTLRIAGSLPSGTRLTLRGDEGERTVAPGELTLPPGAYALEAVADGFRPAATTVTVTAGETAEWAPRLVPIPDDSDDPPPPPPPGRIRIGGSLPAGTVVRVRGNGVDRAVSGTVELPPGAYQFEASASGYEPARETLTVISGQSREWAPRLVAIARPPEPRDTQTTAPPVDPVEEEEAAPSETPEARRAAIVEAIQGFASALESRDPARVRAAWPGISSGALDAWSRLLGASDIRSVRATVEGMGEVPAQGDTVEVPFRLRLDLAGSVSPPPQPYRAVVRRVDGAWILADLVAGGD